MFYSVRKKIFSVLLLVSMSVVQGSAASVPLTDTQLHAVLGIVTGFILSDVDSDGDGVLDSQDAFPHDANETTDTDGDGIGNNADSDDDGDGAFDIDEVAAGSDPLDPDSLALRGKAYKVVTSPYTGHKWLDRNLGASQVCAEYNDPSCYGDYFQWGRGADGHEDRNSATTSTQVALAPAGHDKFIKGHDDWVTATGFDGLYPVSRAYHWSQRDGSSVCPVGFRVPTKDELKAETLDNGVVDRDTAFTSFLKIPASGYRMSSGADNIQHEEDMSIFWTSTYDNDKSTDIYYSNIGMPVGINNSGRSYGFSVRCMKPIVTTDMSPVVTLHSSANVEMIQFGSYPVINVTAVDDVDGILSPFQVGSVNTSVAGTYTLTYTATDSAGHTSNTVTVIITVHPAMKKTGQTVIYDKDGNTHTHAQADSNVSLRDDGYYQKGHDPLYVRDDGDETVTDNITGLMWQDDAAVADAGNKKQWLTDANYNDCRDNGNNCENTSGDTAASYCAALSLGGHEDWRLPTADELVGITDKSKNPAIDNAFQNLVSNHYWSSTIYAGSSVYAWYVYFYDGSQFYSNKNNSWYVRCVRAGQ